MASSTTTLQDLVEVYNSTLIDLLLQAKTRAPGLRKLLRDHGHKAIDQSSDEYIAHAASNLPIDVLVKEETSPMDAFQDETVLAFEPLKGIPFSAIILNTDAAATSNTEAADAEAESSSEPLSKTPIDAPLPNFLFVLATLAATYKSEVDAPASSVLVKEVLDALSGASGASGDEHSILDDDIAALISKVAASKKLLRSAVEPENSAAPAGLDGFLKTLENSKIGDLASEISKEINLSDLENPMDMFNLENLSDNSSVLGSIVSKVGTKIQGKMASGEMDPQDLLKEAMGLFSSFQGASAPGGGGAPAGMPDLSSMMSAMMGNKNMMAGMANMAKAMNGAGGTSGKSARERLAAKQARKNAAKAEFKPAP